jgi:hypothetical protein
LALFAGAFFHIIVGPRPRYLYLGGWQFYGWGIGAIFGTYLASRYSSWGLDLNASKSYSDDARLHRDVSADFDEDAIRTETKIGRSELYWSAFTGYAESRTVFILYLSRKLFLIIPKQPLASAEIDCLRELFRRKLPEKK